METLIPWLFVAGGLVALFIGGEGLVRGAARLALRLGLTPLTVGLTVVAFGTSSPELFVSLKAALSGHSSMAVANVVGSNIGNTGLILGICAIIFPLRVAMRVLRIDMPIVVVASVIVWLMLADGYLDRWEAVLLVVGLILYTVWVLRTARSENQPDVKAEFDTSMPPQSSGIATDAAFILGGLVLLLFGARFLVIGATDIAHSLGLSEVVIGITIVSLGTSLPELAASLVAAFHKKGDIAVGNLVGSNLFNLACILGITGTVSPLEASGIMAVDLLVMTSFAVVLLPLMKTGFTVQRWEGALLLAGYVGYIVWVFHRPAIWFNSETRRLAEWLGFP